jgi:predicted dehydrogenase
MVHDRGVDLLPAESLAPDERRQALIAYRTGDISVPALPEHEALMLVMAEFAGAITERRAPLTDVGAGLRVLTMLDAASRSADQNGARIPLEMEAKR